MARRYFIHGDGQVPGRLWRAMCCTDLPAKLRRHAGRLSKPNLVGQGTGFDRWGSCMPCFDPAWLSLARESLNKSAIA